MLFLLMNQEYSGQVSSKKCKTPLGTNAENEVQTSELLQGVKGTWERSLSSGGGERVHGLSGIEIL
jgi:hypothetical protein